MRRLILITDRIPQIFASLMVCGFVLIGRSLGAAEPLARIEFNRDIRPILSDKCFVCHGPDTARRKAGLRLDQRDAATAPRDGTPAIVSGHAANSELVRRIRSTDPEEQMPPPASTLKLSAAEIQLVTQWIDEGAEYQPHWSFIPLKTMTPPLTRQSEGSRNAIDSFIRARLDREGLTAAAEADRTTLIRRVSFDLTGLPPTPTEVDEFLTDVSPDAYEKLVDRLLASPRYGERMATNWLDAARYADTNGYQTDGPRFMWRWRDWVINAFNRNQPFDEFTIDQLAGDLLDEAAQTPAEAARQDNQFSAPSSALRAQIANDRLIATGFNRNHRGNAEGGIIPEEFRVEYVVDRVETTGTVWLGLTIGCARCHDHKYDPIAQREFYQLFAYFNQVPEPGKYIRNDNSMPYLPAPTADQQRNLNDLAKERDVAESAWRAIADEVQSGIAALADRIRSQRDVVDWSYGEGLAARIAFDGGLSVDCPSKKDGARDGIPCYWKSGDEKFAAGRIGQAAQFDGRRWVEVDEIADFGEDESFAISCWIKPTEAQAMTILAKMDHDNSSRGYELRREANGRLQALFSGRILDDLIRVETKISLPAGKWSHVFVSYDGSSAARGVAIRVNGEPAELTVITDLLSNPIRVKRPLSVGAGGSAPPFMGLIDELRFYRGRLIAQAAESLASADTISQIAYRPLDEKTPKADVEKLREYYLAEHAPEAQRNARRSLLEAQRRYSAYLATVPTTMVMQDALQPRETRLLKRGEYDKPGETVEAGLPAVFQSGRTSKSEGSKRHQDRLDLARWIVSADNPLAARVTVNRYWQSLFGVGLVKTAEDFGTQGEAPSHPELLDWLAAEFQRSAELGARSAEQKNAGATVLNAPSSALRAPRSSAWDIKRLLRRLVTSATYRQSSRVDAALAARDPDNRWLSRGPRFRLPAEMIRDAALATSGLLVETLGGKSVKPYQPPGLWEELSADAVPGPFSIYVQDHGPNLYRRGVYTFRRRTVPPPSLAIFDASPREACRVSLPRTNTPLQALNLMNDVTYVEAARVLAESTMKEGGASAPSRLAWAFRRILSREPNDRELKVLADGLERRWNAYQQHPHDVEQILNLGETPVDKSLPPDELAAYAATVSVIFNVDEFVAKQ